jgi:hypothetical protein
VGKALIIAAIVIAVALVLLALIVVGKALIEGPGVRRRDLRDAQNELGQLRRTLAAIEREAETWSEVDSILASKIKDHIRSDKEGRYSHD